MYYPYILYYAHITISWCYKYMYIRIMENIHCFIWIHILCNHKVFTHPRIRTFDQISCSQLNACPCIVLFIIFMYCFLKVVYIILIFFIFNSHLIYCMFLNILLYMQLMFLYVSSFVFNVHF